MHFHFRAALLATLFVSTAIAPVVAAEINPATAKALEGQVRAWLQGMVGPDLQLPARPVQVTPEGDHYRFVIPIGAARAGNPGAVTLTASVRPLEGGRWSIEGLRVPTPSAFTLDVPVPPVDGATPGQGPGDTMPVDYTVTIGSQDSQGSYDPTLTTPSTLTTSFRDLQVGAKSALIDQLTTVGRSASTGTLRPSGGDRVDLVIDSLTEGYTLRSQQGGGQPVEIAAQRVRVTGEMTAVSRDRVAQIVPALMRVTGGFMAGMPKAGAKAPGTRPSVDPALMRTLVQSMQDFASEFTLDETADGVAVRYGAFSGAAGQVRIGMGAKSDSGLLQARMDLGLDGLLLPDLNLGPMAELVPTRIALRPVLTGIPTQELLQLLAAAGSSGSGRAPPELAALLRRGTVGAGLESFALDVGGASFAGMGRVTITSPETMAGQAQVTATNFDALLQRANAIPDLAGVLPVFVFAKGIARTVEDRLVWDITYLGSKVLVNGTDLSAMMGDRKR